jgi:hypothetical protein
MKRTISFFVTLLCSAALMSAVQPCYAQTTPFLSDDEIRMLSNESPVIEPSITYAGSHTGIAIPGWKASSKRLIT